MIDKWIIFIAFLAICYLFYMSIIGLVEDKTKKEWIHDTLTFLSFFLLVYLVVKTTQLEGNYEKEQVKSVKRAAEGKRVSKYELVEMPVYIDVTDSTHMIKLYDTD